MTHSQNNPLSSPVQYVKGIGEKRAQLLDKAGVKTVHDLLYYVPRRYLDRSTITKIKDLREGKEVTVVGRVESRGIKTGRKPRFIVIISDGTGFLHCVWFNRLEYWAKVFEVGDTIAFSGRVTYCGGFQLVHPEYDRLSDDKEDQFLHTGMIIPLYPSTEELGRSGLDSRGFRKIIKGALNSYIGHIEDTLSEEILQRKGLMPLREAIKNIHFPANFGSLRKARERLKFDELFYLELMLAYRKKQMGQRHKGIEFKLVGERTRSLVEKLPFQLTEAQKKVLREIRADMKQDKPMYRLIQGDVGSGKTIVALVAMLMAVENGYQAALMAPTEILAEQHYLTIHKLLEDLGIKVALLVGGQRKSQRDEVLEAVQSGEVEIVIGTHALIQEGVTFKKLGLVVIDEQHRFGVMQRATLREKGLNPDVLVMTATPIPRTLSLTVYGDLDVSII
ncbi:MAG: ATP-dependent DNA helicase RecG, partial [candidate division KSB1 bacterium]|nr:ATP-dependent DNA helicase RecG [candidate division KSB1 bacterium]